MTDVTLSKDEQRFIAVLKFMGSPEDNEIAILDRKANKLVDLLRFKSFNEAGRIAYNMSVWAALQEEMELQFQVDRDLFEGVVR